MLRVIRPSFEVVKEGRIFLTEKMSMKYSSPTRVPSVILSNVGLFYKRIQQIKIEKDWSNIEVLSAGNA
jgi:hypothetical protein